MDDQLLKDTLAFLQDPLQPRGSLLASKEEWLFFQEKKTKQLSPLVAPAATPIFIKPAPLPTEPVKKQPPAPQPVVLSPTPPTPVTAKPAPVAIEPLKKTVQQIAPHLALTDAVPDDAEAKRVASGWKETVTDAEVILLACDREQETLELLKNLAKAIDGHLARSKVIAAERLEKEKRWDLFLEKNRLRLLIASDQMQKMPELLRFYRAVPAQSQFFLGETPLLPLLPASTYRAIDKKAALWKTLCQMLKK